MPRDSNGAYSLPNGTLVSAGQTIQVSQHNPAMTDIAGALSQSLSRTGQGAMQADLNMGGYDVTNANNISVGGTLTIAGTAFDPAAKANVAGQQFSGDISIVKSSGNVQLTLNRSGSGGVTFAMQSDGNFLLYRDGAPVFNHTGGSSPFDFAVPIRQFGRATPSSTRGSGRQVVINDGTSAPSGGGDGDLYFQYSP